MFFMMEAKKPYLRHLLGLKVVDLTGFEPTAR